jgi:hypothetical protein
LCWTEVLGTGTPWISQARRLWQHAAPDYGKIGNRIEKSFDPLPLVHAAGDRLPDKPPVAAGTYPVKPPGALIDRAKGREEPDVHGYLVWPHFAYVILV